MNLPTNNGHVQKLVLSSRPIPPYMNAGLDRLEYFFSDTLPPAIDPGILFQTGWKVRVSGATLDYCETCRTDCGLAPILLLRGDPGSVDFYHDPADTMRIYINRNPRRPS